MYSSGGWKIKLLKKWKKELSLFFNKRPVLTEVRVHELTRTNDSVIILEIEGASIEASKAFISLLRDAQRTNGVVLTPYKVTAFKLTDKRTYDEGDI